MNHQVQHSVLVDNEWVSRPVDVYQILAQARASDTEMPDTIVKPTAHIPQLGILSRTVLASPVFKFICPANIRHKDLNDIVLVGEKSIQLKEIRDYGHLRHVATKSDFSGRILAARVFGDPREVPINVGSSLPHKQTLNRGRSSMVGDEECVLPPEVIALTLTSRTLMFLWARHTHTGIVSFSQKTIQLPAGASRFDRFGTFLAIDSKCRAMAVAAPEGRFILYKTKHMERWRQELRHASGTTPIEDERIIPIEGRVKHMEFLSSGAGQDDYHVVLLFIIVHQGRTKITCFDWDCRQDLSQVTARTERALVDFEDHNPALLIPLNRTSDFLLVFDTHISVYKDVLCGVPRRMPAAINADVLPSLLPGDSKRRPLWVAWYKTPRNPEFPKEAFYVAREDGRVMYAERGPAGAVETEDAGEWPYRIDTAFACPSVDNSEFSQLYPDVLIAGGVGNDGLLCKVGAWPAEYPYALPYPGTNQFTYVESIPNWTPLTDLSVTRLPGLRAPHERDRSSMLIANGATPHGEISELRYGLQSFVDDSFSGMEGCTSIWVVDHGSQKVDINGKTARQHYATLVITLPPETLLIRINRTQRESRCEFPVSWEERVWDKIQIPTDDEQIHDGVMRDVETISACLWSEHFVVQITRKEARILRRSSLHHSDSIVYNSPLLLAAVRPCFPFIAIASRESGNAHLEIVLISHDGHFVRNVPQTSRFQLQHDPTCIELFDVEGIFYVFVSTLDLKIILLRVDHDGTLYPMLEDSLANIGGQGERMLLESAVLLATRKEPVLVCATRNGYLLSSPFLVTSQNAHRFAWNVVKMGATSAQITASATDNSVAFVSCGSDFCRVRCSASGASALEIDSIWFTNLTNPGYLQSPVTAVYQLPFIRDVEDMGRNLGGFLFAVAGDHLLFSLLESDIRWSAHDVPSSPQNDCRAVPRKLLTGSKPANLLYLKVLRKMVVSTIEAKEEKAPPDGHRVLHSTIKLLNLHHSRPLEDSEVKQEAGDGLESSLVAAQYPLKHGERVYSIVEWLFTDHRNKKYNLIIVGTGVPGSSGKETGRRLILNLGRNGTKLQLQKESALDHPVYSTAVYSNETSVSAIGRTLTFDIFESGAGKLSKRATIDLPSPGVHLTVQAPFVYVSTLQHSHLCFEIVSSSAEGKYEFQRVFTDSRERKCSSHLVLDIHTGDNATQEQQTLVLVTDKNSSSVSGIYHPPDRTYKNASETVFEACLPHAVVRMQRGNIRPPWRRPAISGKPPSGVLVDDVIGACSDGTIYTFSILSEPARHMLRFLHNVIEEKQKRDPSTRHTFFKPRSGNIMDILMNSAEGAQDAQDSGVRVRDVDPRHQEHRQAGPRHKHIDGDLLVRWRNEGGDLANLVHKDTEKGVGALFIEFAKALRLDRRSEPESTDTGNKNSDDEDIMVMVRQWLDEVLMPVL